MKSLTAGSPSCNCKNPDTCIHSFILNVKNREFIYKQRDFISIVNTIDDDGKGVPLSLSLIGKSCVTQNEYCPKGAIYSFHNNNSLMTFNKGLSDYKAYFLNDFSAPYNKYDCFDFINEFILSKPSLNALPRTNYLLRVGQCNGEPFKDKPLTFMDGVLHIFKYSVDDALWTYINIFPPLTWEVTLSIGVERQVHQYTDIELKTQQKEQNKKDGLSQRGARGWTKRPDYGITSSMEVEGNLSTKLGSEFHEYSATLKKEFKNKAKKLNLLDKALNSIDIITSNLSTQEGKDAQIKLLHTEIIYPKIEIKGGGELKEYTKSEGLYFESQVSLNLAPLIGMRITLDLIQAFAAWYRADVLVAVVRENLMSQEDAYKEGKNAAFIGMKFELVVEGEVCFNLGFQSNEASEWEAQSLDTADARLKLSINANVRAGIRFYIADGALEVGGEAVAEGCIGLDRNTNDNIELVFFHNGITAKVYVSMTANIASTDVLANDNDEDSLMGGSPGDVSGDKGHKKEMEWIIHDKLDKKESTARVRLF